jgi:hypothetical protein
LAHSWQTFATSQVRGSAFHILFSAKGTTSLILAAALCLSACGEPGPLDVEVIVGAGSVTVFVKDRGLDCHCAGEVLDVGECEMWGDISTGCSCETEPSGCEVEARLLRGDVELAAVEPAAVPVRQYLTTGSTGVDGTETLELSSCGTSATIDLPPPLETTASFTVASSPGEVVLEWSGDASADRVHVECGGFVGYTCARAPSNPISISDTLCDGTDGDTLWAMRLYERVRSKESDIGNVEVWRTASAEWNRE